MKVILTVTTPTLQSDLDPRFGRGAHFLVVDTDTLEWHACPNPGLNAPGGAGIAAAQFAVDQHAQAIISGDFGPNAFDALQAAGVAMYLFGTCQTVDQVLADFKAGRLARLNAPTRPDRPATGKA